MSLNPFDALAAAAIGAATMTFGATFSHVLRHPRLFKTAETERKAFAALYVTQPGQVGSLLGSWAFLADLATSSEEDAPEAYEEMRSLVVAPTLALLDSLDQSKLLPLLNAAATDAYWATARFERAAQQLARSLSVLQTQRPAQPETATPEQVLNALRSLQTSLIELKGVAARHRLIRHDADDESVGPERAGASAAR